MEKKRHRPKPPKRLHSTKSFFRPAMGIFSIKKTRRELVFPIKTPVNLVLMYKEALKRLKKELENRLLEILEQADLREDFKEKILGLEFGSINYQTYTAKVKGKEYEYHHLSANFKNPETGKWKTIPLKHLRRQPEWFIPLVRVYSALKKVDSLMEDLESLGMD